MFPSTPDLAFVTDDLGLLEFQSHKRKADTASVVLQSASLDTRWVNTVPAYRAGKGGRVALHARSAIAQLAVDVTKHTLDECHASKQRNRVIVAGTLRAYTEEARALLATAAVLHADKQPVKLARISFLPDAARLKAIDVRGAIEQAQIRCPGGEVQEDGSVLLPLLPERHFYNPNTVYTEQILRSVLLGQDSARSRISAHRTTVPLPDLLNPGEFFVGGIDLDCVGHHAVLDSHVLCREAGTPVARHLTALFLDAGRTDKRGGTRQVEIVPVNGSPVNLHTARVRVEFFRAAHIAEPGS